MKTSELTGAALDWAVELAQLLGRMERDPAERVALRNVRVGISASTNWAQGGPIIEREITDLVIQQSIEGDGRVHAYIDSDKPTEVCCWGPTILIAAMRCFVASKLGDEVEVPEELK